jgi:hypothetical protein
MDVWNLEKVDFTAIVLLVFITSTLMRVESTNNHCIFKWSFMLQTNNQQPFFFQSSYLDSPIPCSVEEGSGIVDDQLLSSRIAAYHLAKEELIVLTTQLLLPNTR